MSANWSNLKKTLAESPLGKVVGAAIFDALIAIDSGGIVYEMSSDGNIKWNSFYDTNSFWILLVVILLYYFYKKPCINMKKIY